MQPIVAVQQHCLRIKKIRQRLLILLTRVGVRLKYMPRGEMFPSNVSLKLSLPVFRALPYSSAPRQAEAVAAGAGGVAICIATWLCVHASKQAKKEGKKERKKDGFGCSNHAVRAETFRVRHRFLVVDPAVVAF